MNKIIVLLIVIACFLVPSYAFAEKQTNATRFGQVQVIGDERNIYTPKLYMGEDTAEDVDIVFMGNAQDFYICMDDSEDDLVIGLGSVCGTAPIVSFDENLGITVYGDQIYGGDTPTITIGDGDGEDTKLIYDGNSDDWTLGIYNTTDDLQLVHGSTFNTDKYLTFSDTAPTITIGNATTAVDINMVFDGNAQDYHIGLQDSSDDLFIGLGVAAGTTPALSIDENQVINFYQDPILQGTTPFLIIGDAGDEDAGISFDVIGGDMYIAVDDADDDLVIGAGATIGTDARISIDEGSDVTIITLGDGAEFDTKLIFDGNEDDFLFAIDDGTNDFVIAHGTDADANRYITLSDTVTTITFGNATVSDDINLVFDGNAKDFHIGLQDSTDNLFIGYGVAAGTTPALSIDEAQVVTFFQNAIFGGDTPTLTIGDAGNEDTWLEFDGSAQNYYIGVDEADTYVDQLVVGLGSAIGTTPAFSVSSSQITTFYQDPVIVGTTPQLTIGDAGDEDAILMFDVVGGDMYVAIYNSNDDLIIGAGGTIGTDARISIDESADSTTITLGDAAEFDLRLIFDGNEDDFAISLDDATNDLVIGHGSTVDDDRYITLSDSAPTITFGNATTAVDITLVFDGNAKDYYICADDDVDDLVIGYGSTCGTTPAIRVDENQQVTIGGAVTDELVITAAVQGTIIMDGTTDDTNETTLSVGDPAADTTVCIGGGGCAEIVTETNAIGADECGKIFYLYNATGFDSTLPAVGTDTLGCDFTFVLKSHNNSTDHQIITGNSHEDVIFGHVIENETDTGDDGIWAESAKDTIDLKAGFANIGDIISVRGDGTLWFVSGIVNADGGATFSNQ